MRTFIANDPEGLYSEPASPTTTVGRPERVAEMKSSRSCDFRQKGSGGADDIVTTALDGVGHVTEHPPTQPAFRQFTAIIDPGTPGYGAPDITTMPGKQVLVTELRSGRGHWLRPGWHPTPFGWQKLKDGVF